MRILLTLIPLLLLVGACKKYPEGGSQWKAKRAFKSINRDWEVSLFEVNGIDSTAFVTTDNDPESRKKYVNFSEYDYNLLRMVLHHSSSHKIKFDGNYVTFTGGESAYGDMLGGQGFKIREVLTPDGPETTWRIMKCKRHEMILEASGRDGVHYYRLVLKNDYSIF